MQPRGYINYPSPHSSSDRSQTSVWWRERSVQMINLCEAFRSRFVLVATRTLTHTVVHDGGGVHTIKKKNGLDPLNISFNYICLQINIDGEVEYLTWN